MEGWGMTLKSNKWKTSWELKQQKQQATSQKPPGDSPSKYHRWKFCWVARDIEKAKASRSLNAFGSSQNFNERYTHVGIPNYIRRFRLFGICLRRPWKKPWKRTNVSIKKMITEVLLILPLYLILFFIWWWFRHPINIVSDAGRIITTITFLVILLMLQKYTRKKKWLVLVYPNLRVVY